MISDRLMIASWALPVAGFSLLTLPQPAQAILTYYIYESGGNVEVKRWERCNYLEFRQKLQKDVTLP